MPKVTVYLSDSLARAVKAAGIRASTVCRRALEEEVDRTRVRTPVDERAVRGAAARMRDEGAPLQHDAFVRGYATGERWALGFAPPESLSAIEDWFCNGWPERAVVERVPGEDDTLVEALELHHDDPWAQGFVEGAIDAWDQIAASLDVTGSPVRREQPSPHRRGARRAGDAQRRA